MTGVITTHKGHEGQTPIPRHEGSSPVMRGHEVNPSDVHLVGQPVLGVVACVTVGVVLLGDGLGFLWNMCGNVCEGFAAHEGG